MIGVDNIGYGFPSVQGLPGMIGFRPGLASFGMFGPNVQPDLGGMKITPVEEEEVDEDEDDTEADNADDTEAANADNTDPGPDDSTTTDSNSTTADNGSNSDSSSSDSGTGDSGDFRRGGRAG